jgi:cell growth-regulating nucleolar protein
MVWFQCEDCGENLKKPKLAGHFRSCSAWKVSTTHILFIPCSGSFSGSTVGWAAYDLRVVDY